MKKTSETFAEVGDSIGKAFSGFGVSATSKLAEMKYVWWWYNIIGWSNEYKSFSRISDSRESDMSFWNSRWCSCILLIQIPREYLRSSPSFQSFEQKTMGLFGRTRTVPLFNRYYGWRYNLNGIRKVTVKHVEGSFHVTK